MLLTTLPLLQAIAAKAGRAAIEDGMASVEFFSNMLGARTAISFLKFSISSVRVKN